MIRTLKILGERIKVKYKDLNPENICGRYSYDSKTIEVNSKLDKHIQDVTLIHEVIHATIHRAGINNAQLSADLEEIICDQVAKVIVENFTLKRKNGR